MSKITTILSLACAVSALGANPISVSFVDTPLPAALKTIEQLAGEDITINFSFRKLEDYTVTTEMIDATQLEAISQTIGFYPIKATCSGHVITVQPILDTDYRICGRLVNDSGEGVDYATVTVLSLPDSLTVTCGVSNLRGDFVIPVQSDRPVALRASRIGYKTATVAANAGNIGDFRLETDPHMLRDITAYTDRKIITTVGAVTNIRVEGTPYSRMGTLADMLPNLPGLLLPQSASGANAIIYYINGREVSETAQINMLRSDEIKDISIDKAPGAEYPADAAVVVNIATVRTPGDFINLQLSNTMQIRRKLSDRPDVDFKMQIRRFTTALNLKYDYLKSKTTECYYRDMSQPLKLIWLRSIRDVDNMDKGPRLNWSGELQFNPHSRLGLYYYFYSINNKVEQVGKTDSYDYGTYDVLSYQSSKSSLHSGTVCYDYTGKHIIAHLAQDIAYTNPYSGLSVVETQNRDITSRYEANDHEYFVTTTNARLGLKLAQGTFISLGGRLSYIESNSMKFFSDGWQFDDSYAIGDGVYGNYHKYNNMNVTETTAQGYLSINQRIGNILIVPGIRYEYTDRWISDNARISNPNPDNGPAIKLIDYVYDRHYGHWLPSLMVKYSHGDFYSTLNFVSRMVQPTFSMLNSGLVYEDNFTYYNSNPLLKPTSVYDMRLSAGYRGLTAEIGYKRTKNSIAEIMEDPSYASVVNPPLYRTPINLKNYHETDVNLAYTSSIGRFGYYAAANMVIPGWNTVYYSKQKVTFNAELNLTYTLNRKLSLYTNFKHIGSCRWMVYDSVDSQLLNAGANLSLLGNRLNINVEATDLLDRNHTMTISTVYDNISNTRDVDCDSRGIRLRIAYTLFSKPIRTNVHRGNIDDIDRIER